MFLAPGLARLIDRAASLATSSRLIHQSQNLMTNPPKTLDANQAPPELDLESVENTSTPTRRHESAEFDANSDFENFQFSETLGKYVAYLKSIKRPKIINSKLLDGVDRVS